MSEEGSSQFVLRSPDAKVTPKVQYMNLMFSSFYKFVEVAGGQGEITSIQKRIEILTDVIINFIPNPKERIRLKDKLDSKIQEASSSYEDVDRYNNVLLKIHTSIMGEVMELCDDFLAIVEKQEIMTVMDKSERKRLETKFYPLGLPQNGVVNGEDQADEVIEG